MPAPCSAEQMAVAVQIYKNAPMAVGKQTSLLSDECLMLNSLSRKILWPLFVQHFQQSPSHCLLYLSLFVFNTPLLELQPIRTVLHD